VESYNYEFMKRLIFLLLLVLPLAGHTQGFFGKVEHSTLTDAKQRGISNVWMVRPLVTLNAMQITLSNPAEVKSLNSLGTGVSYARFSDFNGVPYQNFAVNLLVLFGTEIADVSPLELSVAAGVTCWQYLSVGVGYNFMNKKPFILTGISYSFN
jgi:hypothetical protein